MLWVFLFFVKFFNFALKFDVQHYWATAKPVCASNGDTGGERSILSGHLVDIATLSDFRKCRLLTNFQTKRCISQTSDVYA